MMAVAMLASRIVGLALHLWLWRRRLTLRPARRDWWLIRRARLAPVLHIGLPGAAENIAWRLAMMVTVPIVGIVEHDAYILTFLYTIKELQADGVAAWPLWWSSTSTTVARASRPIWQPISSNPLCRGAKTAPGLGSPWCQRSFPIMTAGFRSKAPPAAPVAVPPPVPPLKMRSALLPNQ